MSGPACWVLNLAAMKIPHGCDGAKGGRGGVEREQAGQVSREVGPERQTNDQNHRRWDEAAGNGPKDGACDQDGAPHGRDEKAVEESQLDVARRFAPVAAPANPAPWRQESGTTQER